MKPATIENSFAQKWARLCCRASSNLTASLKPVKFAFSAHHFGQNPLTILNFGIASITTHHYKDIPFADIGRRIETSIREIRTFGQTI
jgi:hypothetical protein